MTYPGGKGGCFRHIINQMPLHECYIETHLGAGSVLRNKRPSESSIAIDVDEEVLNRFRSEYPEPYVPAVDMLDRDNPPDQPELLIVRCDAGEYLASNSHHFGPEVLLYADPPYLMESRRSQKRMYAHEMNEEDHHTLLHQLINAARIGANVMISGYRTQMYDRFLADWRRIEFTSSTRSGKATESLWMSFEAPAELHDYRWIGDDYREREKRRKRERRWTARLAKMDPAERDAMLRQLLAAAPPETAWRAIKEIHGEPPGSAWSIFA